MPRPLPLLLHHARTALRVSQNELSQRLGVSRRTGQRWNKGGGPIGIDIHNLARLVFPVDAALATEIALVGATTLEALGLVPMPVMPQSVRPAVLAAFACAKELGLTVEAVERVLRTRNQPLT
jgi:transcriptional regulator with XRE-family HTH domain